jgi:hypothetical protein
MEDQLPVFSLSPMEKDLWSASHQRRLDGRLGGLHTSYGRCCEEEKLAQKNVGLFKNEISSLRSPNP